MLRKAVALLLLLNLIWWAWAKGWFTPLGLPATPAGDPDFLARQVRPEALHVQPLPPGTAVIMTVPPAPNPPITPGAMLMTPPTAPVVALNANTGKKHHNPRR